MLGVRLAAYSTAAAAALSLTAHDAEMGDSAETGDSAEMGDSAEKGDSAEMGDSY